MDYLKIAQIGISALGALKSSKKSGDAAGAYGAGLAALQALQVPGLEDLQQHLQEYVLQGEITPEEYKSYMLDKSAEAGIKIPAEILDTQYQTLHELKDVVDNGGLTAVDRARIEDAKTQVLTAARGNALATKNEFASRGMGGSGLEAASRLAGDSAATQAASKAGFDAAALAQASKLAALSQLGQQSNTMRTAEYQQQKDAADAADRIAQYNTTAAQTTSNNNTTTKNAAEAANLATRQKIANQNIDIKNAQEKADADSVQQEFDDQYKKAGGMNSAGTVAGNGYTKDAATTASQYAGYADALPKIVSLFKKDDTVASDRRVKTDVSDMSDDEVDEILDGLTGKKYKYARNFGGDGTTHMGVMAQDVENTPMAPAVSEDENGVKRLDTKEVATTALSMLPNLHKRIKKLEGK